MDENCVLKLSYGQMTEVAGVLVLTGLGRIISLMTDNDEQGMINNYYYTACHIYEGQFYND